MTTKPDALGQYYRDLEAERRHTNPDRMRRQLAGPASAVPATAAQIKELVDAVEPYRGGRPVGRKHDRLHVIPERESA